VSDHQIRTLARAASLGDEDAAAALRRAEERAGLAPVEVGPGLLVGDAIATYILAGRAEFTLYNPRTGNRLSYQVSRAQANKWRGDPPPQGLPYFVRGLVGSDNDDPSAWRYLGRLSSLRGLSWCPAASFREPEPSVAVLVASFGWLTRHLGSTLGEVEVWHTGRCGWCRRKLTVPESIAAGIGPECRRKLTVPEMTGPRGQRGAPEESAT